MATIYKHAGKELFTDEEDVYTAEEIRIHYAEFDKTLAQAVYTTTPPAKEGDPTIVEFAKKTGTKGVGIRAEWTAARAEFQGAVDLALERWRVTGQAVHHPCPKCGHDTHRVQGTQTVACYNAPTCDYTADIPADVQSRSQGQATLPGLD